MPVGDVDFDEANQELPTMTAKQLERIVHSKPFKPYRLVLVNGEEVLVTRPRKSHVSGPQVALVGQVRARKNGPAVEEFRIINIDRITSAEQLPRKPQS
jgi:hypothetical protein